MIEAGKKVRLPDGRVGTVFAYLSDGRVVVSVSFGITWTGDPAELGSVPQ